MRKEFEDFTDLSLEWNEKINTTAIRDREEFITKNVIDSLSLCNTTYLNDAKNIIDIGTGGGLPGIPLAIQFPEKHFTLVDSVAKKLKVVDDICEKLGITNVTTVHGRFEDLAQNPAYREQFDAAVSRAVANMSTLSEYCLPFVMIGGIFVAYKTETAADEIKAASNALKILGGSSIEITPAGVEGLDHVFAAVKKLSSTPKKYPRKAGEPSKNPL